MDPGVWNEFAHLVIWTYQHETKEKRYQPQPHGALHKNKDPIHQTLAGRCTDRLDPTWGAVKNTCVADCSGKFRSFWPNFKGNAIRFVDVYVEREREIYIYMPYACAFIVYIYIYIHRYTRSHTYIWYVETARQGLRSCDPSGGAEYADRTWSFRPYQYVWRTCL